MGGWGMEITGPGNTPEKDWKGALWEGTAVVGREENQVLGRGILSLARGGALELKKLFG